MSSKSIIFLFLFTLFFSQSKPDYKSLINEGSSIYKNTDLIMESDIDDEGSGVIYSWTKKSRTDKKDRTNSFEVFKNGYRVLFGTANYSVRGTHLSTEVFHYEGKQPNEIYFKHSVYDEKGNFLFDRVFIQNVYKMKLSRETQNVKDSVQKVVENAQYIINETESKSDRANFNNRLFGKEYDPSDEDIREKVYDFFKSLYEGD